MATYTATATRSGSWWAIQVEELDGVWTQARRLDQVEAMTRDAIALLLEVPEDSFDVAVRVELPDEMRTAIEELHAAKANAEAASAEASQVAQRTVQTLHNKARLPLRDIGQVLGVSYQRAHQLLRQS
jgi:predicted RNase H-like HicB family nuclease